MFDTESFIYMGNCEDYKDMVRRLKNLNKDLNGTDEESTDSFVRLCRLYEDKKLDLMDVYAQYYTGAKITDTQFIPSGSSDMTDYMIHFSEGYDVFIKKIEKHYSDIVRKRKEAILLFTCMVSLPLSMSSLLYLTYFKELTPDEVTHKLYISRSTYYRMKHKAVELLMVKFKNHSIS